MSPQQIVDEAKKKLQAATDHFNDDLKKLRTGRASAGMLEAYGAQMPLNQVATVTGPEAQLIQISPFDPGNLQTISAAIRDNPSLGLNPSDDGHVIRIPVPPLTEERRRDIVKLVGQKQEECMISLRNARHEALDAINQAKKDKLVGEDDSKRLEKQVDDALNAARGQADAAAKAKEQEILTL
jgi:ribosome recycling factor